MSPASSQQTNQRLSLNTPRHALQRVTELWKESGERAHRAAWMAACKKLKLLTKDMDEQIVPGRVDGSHKYAAVH